MRIYPLAFGLSSEPIIHYDFAIRSDSDEMAAFRAILDLVDVSFVSLFGVDEVIGWSLIEFEHVLVSSKCQLVRSIWPERARVELCAHCRYLSNVRSSIHTHDSSIHPFAVAHYTDSSTVRCPVDASSTYIKALHCFPQ